MPNRHPNKACSHRKPWSTPQLRSADIKALTGGGQGSGADFGTMLGMMMLSDARLKRDIVASGEHVHGIPIHAFRYIWGGPLHVGVLAQDVQVLAPEAASADAIGVLRVDYARIGVEPVVIPV